MCSQTDSTFTLPVGCAGLFRPVANLLGALHGVPRVADVVGLERHHGLHLQQRGVDEGVVHALAGSARDDSQSRVTNSLQTATALFRREV